VTTSEPSAIQPVRAEPAERTKIDRERVIIRTYPKTIFLYPIALVAFLCGMATLVGLAEPRTLGFIFTTIAFFNLIVISFEFRKSTPVVLVLLLLVLVLGGVLLNERFGVIALIGVLYGKLDLSANAQFYFGVAGGYGLVLLLVMIAARFDYWEVRGNEILHHTGLLGDCERYPAPQMQIRKEIVDVFEFMLLLSGRLIIFPSGRERAIVLENVPSINSIERRMTELLDSLRVTVEKDVNA
jgi:hypothetical protein